MNEPELWYWLTPLILGIIGAAFVGQRVLRKNSAHAKLAHARTLFQQQRPQLETLFLRTAGAAGKPRGLRWTNCQWTDLIEWVREKETGRLMAMVGVTISFEAIEGSDMEGVEAVGNLRNASAVFHFDGDQWGTSGRAIFNLNPDEAVERFKEGYERI